jgi:proteasome alpha subunit
VLICEIGTNPGETRLFKVTYDGTLLDHRGVSAIGGKGDALEQAVRAGYREGMALSEVISLGIEAFRQAESRESEGWEAAVLDRTGGRRAFRRLTPEEMVTV